LPQSSKFITQFIFFAEQGQVDAQTVSAFFVHDLKNLASTLSLTMQNLPEHFDDPDFRKDAMSTISKSVAKINDMRLPAV